jgi:hypothetical protein
MQVDVDRAVRHGSYICIVGDIWARETLFYYFGSRGARCYSSHTNTNQQLCRALVDNQTAYEDVSIPMSFFTIPFFPQTECYSIVCTYIYICSGRGKKGGFFYIGQRPLKRIRSSLLSFFEWKRLPHGNVRPIVIRTYVLQCLLSNVKIWNFWEHCRGGPEDGCVDWT